MKPIDILSKEYPDKDKWNHLCKKEIKAFMDANVKCCELDIISPELRLDTNISHYKHAARLLGYKSNEISIITKDGKIYAKRKLESETYIDEILDKLRGLSDRDLEKVLEFIKSLSM